MSNFKKNKRIFFSDLIDRKKKIYIFIILPILALTIYLNLGLQAPLKAADYKTFQIESGESFDSIISRLQTEGFIKSKSITKAYSFLTGSAHKLKPGLYELSAHLSSDDIISRLTRGTDQVKVLIPEGSSVFEVDALLSKAKILKAGELVAYAEKNPIEGHLFPDTYKFFLGSDVGQVINSFESNFNKNIGKMLEGQPNPQDILTLASIVEREVPGFEDRQIVAGLLKKRIKIGMPLQVDATLCYAKELADPSLTACYPLDTKISSPYNTYQYKGLPPGPISSPGVSAVRAVIEAKDSPYLFYISDPATKKTIFAENLEDHNRNIFVYLKN